MSKTLRYFAIVVSLTVFGLPMLWMVFTAFKSPEEYLTNPWLLPISPTLENFSRVLAAPGFARSFANSFFVTCISVLFTVALAAPAAYASARLSFRGERAVLAVFLLGMTIPVHITLIPMLKLTGVLGLSDDLFGLSMVYAAFGLALTFFILRSAFSQMPKEIEEAAILDGCGSAQVFWFVALPLIRPSLIVVAVLNFINNFNEFAFALTLLRSNEIRTLPLAIMYFEQEQGTDITAVAAAITLAIAPIFALFLFAQRQIISGITAGAVKG